MASRPFGRIPTQCSQSLIVLGSFKIGQLSWRTTKFKEENKKAHKSNCTYSSFNDKELNYIAI
ncbi:hypothetical protein CR513_27060, partial [Mucuna pruriens]